MSSTVLVVVERLLMLVGHQCVLQSHPQRWTWWQQVRQVVEAPGLLVGPQRGPRGEALRLESLLVGGTRGAGGQRK